MPGENRLETERTAAQGCPTNNLKLSTGALAVCATLYCLLPHSLDAAELKGVVVDPSARPIPGAQVAAVYAGGVITQQITDDHGAFDIYVSPLYDEVQLRIAAAGFQTVTAGMGASRIQLSLAPQSDSIRVAGSALDVPASRQGSSVTTISSAELRDRNEAQAADLIRYTPGVELAQSGPRGSVTSLFVRGSDSKYNLVLLDGIPVNSFYYGGLFDFAHIPSDLIQEIDIARGPQSAIYGSYALGSVVSFETRAPENGPAFDALAEGGSHAENRVALSGSGMPLRDWGIAGSLSSFTGNGSVPNADYQNTSVFLSTSYRWRTMHLFAFGDYDANNAGEPGPFGSNPQKIYSGIDRVSRSKNETSTYGLRWQDAVTDNLRADVMAGFFLNNSLYLSKYGASFNKDIRGYAEGRLTYTVNKYWSMAGGYAFDREEMRNTYVTVTNGSEFLLRRDNGGVYWDHQIDWRNFHINAGLREEIYMTPLVPANANGYPARPVFPARTDTKLNPKISGAYTPDSVTRLHASFGTGIRPPGGSDLAFTNNPALKPERTQSYDIGVERQLMHRQLALDLTWFRNSYKDLIVSLGGNLATLSAFSTDNVANARAKGLEATAHCRPSSLSWLTVTGNYLWLETAVLSLNGGSGLVQRYYYLGQPLVRRPKQSGSVVATLSHGKFEINPTLYFRGHSLDVEPNYGASAGEYWNAGYVNLGINVNYRLKNHVTVYANLRNALDRRYEEIYGYPSPLLNFVAGVKWSLARAR